MVIVDDCWLQIYSIKLSIRYVLAKNSISKSTTTPEENI